MRKRTPSFKVLVARQLSRKMNKDRMEIWLDDCLRISLNPLPEKQREYWDITHKFLGVENSDGYLYTWEVRYRKVGGRIRDPERVKREWAKILIRLEKAISSTKFGQYPFYILDKKTKKVGGFTVVVEGKKSKPKQRVGEIHVPNIENPELFKGIYGRENHIMRIQGALATAQSTKMEIRHHVLLWGPPGGCKTDLLLRFGKGLGQRDRDWLYIDATTTTQAGILAQLMDKPILPPVMFVEEIEKATTDALLWLLGVMDQRGMISKIDARAGKQVKAVKILICATANDEKKLRRAMAGALLSRFAHRLYCDRPNRELMGLILGRELATIGGNDAWIEPTLEFCWDELGMRDAREIKPICVDGRERLLDQSYQAAVRATLGPIDQEEDE